MHISSRLGLPHIFGHAYHAVDLFFVLSGFVLAANYEPRLLEGSFGLEFLYRRIVRIAPMLIFGAALGYVSTTLVSDEFGLPYLVSALLLIPAVALPEMFPLNPVEWSLMFELIANVLHAVSARWLSTNRLMVVVGSLAAIGIQLDVFYGHLSGGNAGDTLVLGLWRVLYGYTAGILIYRFWTSGKLPRIPIPLSLLVVLMMMEFAVPGRAVDGLRDAIFMIFFSPLIVSAALGPQRRPVSTQLSTLLGRLSYPLYLVHWPVLLIAMYLLQESASILLCTVSVIATLGVSVATAWVSLIYFDEPVRRFLLSVSYRRPA